MKARMLTQRGMLTSPALTSTRKRTRSSCARAISQRKIATTSDAGLLFIATPAPPFESESGEESTIPALMAYCEHDFSNLLIRLHISIRFDDGVEGEDLGDFRFEFSGVDPFVDVAL